MKKTDEQWRAALTAEQYNVCREKATERPFSGRYNDCQKPGMYRCTCCGNELFSSETKIDKGTGWPSFTAATNDDRVTYTPDTSHGMRRVEVSCSQCDCHLGHVFDDDSQASGRYFCINSVALDLDEDADSA